MSRTPIVDRIPGDTILVHPYGGEPVEAEIVEVVDHAGPGYYQVWMAGSVLLVHATVEGQANVRAAIAKATRDEP